MEQNQYKEAFNLFYSLYNKNANFHRIIDKGMKEGKIRFFNSTEWNKIESQNYRKNPRVPKIEEFSDMFKYGLNIGNCGGASRQLSFSYDDVDWVAGILPILKGTRNAEKEGGHMWLENRSSIIDTSLMLVIDKSYKSELGYIEESRIRSYTLNSDRMYSTAKEFATSRDFKKARR